MAVLLLPRGWRRRPPPVLALLLLGAAALAEEILPMQHLHAPDKHKKLVDGRIITPNLKNASSPTCEPYCTSPCAELHGNPDVECATCTENYTCHPGAIGYPNETESKAWEGSEAKIEL